MSFRNPFEAGTGRWRDALLWGGAGLAVVTAHVASAAWLASRPAIAAPEEAGPQAAIMIELAAAPEALNVDTTQVSTDMQDAVESAGAAQPEPMPEPPAPELPTPEPVVEPTPEPEPVIEQAAVMPPAVEPEPTPEVTEPIPTPEPVVLPEMVEVPLPVVKPPPAPVQEKKPEPVTKRTVERKKPVVRPAPSSAAAVVAAAPVTQSNRNAAEKSSAGNAVPSVSPANWQSKVQAHLARRKRQLVKARGRGEVGTVYVRFNIDTGGNVLSVALSRSSGYASLDQDVLAMVRSASPVPAPPPNVNRTLTVPFQFTSR